MSQSKVSSFHDVRMANKDDIPEICGIERSATSRFGCIPVLAFLVDADVLSPKKVEEWLDTGRIYMFDDESGRAIGFLAVVPMDTVLYIAEISVLTDQHGKGAGTVLIDAAKDWARERARDGANSGSSMARISLTTYPDVPWNGPFYRKRGFVEVDAATIGPKHVAKMTTDEEERALVQPGYRRCCMLWEDR